MARPDLVARTGSRVISIPSTYRATPAYREWKDAVAKAATYEQLVCLLERATVNDRLAALLDFAPTEAYSCKFLNSTVAYLARPQTDQRRALAHRARAALAAVQFGDDVRPRRGRKAGPPLDATLMAQITDARTRWNRDIKPLWQAAGEDRSGLLKAIEMVGRERLPSAAAYRMELRHLLRRRNLKRGELVNQLTAWTIGVPVRRVREAISDADHTLHIFA